MIPGHSNALAAHPFKSYRYKGPYGWIMIGALDHSDALREARRSSNDASADGLEVWDGAKYVPASSSELDAA